MEYSEEVTKSKLEFYIKYSRTIEIVPVDNEEPIFVLKDLSPMDGIAVIRKGKFILGIQVYDYWIPKHSKNGIFSVEFIPTEDVSPDEDYLNQHRSRTLPSKEFSMQSILDNTIQLKNSDIPYIKYVRNFLRASKCLESRKGKYVRDNKETKERFEFVCNAYKQIKGEKGFSLHQMSKVIQDMWFAKLAERYRNNFKAMNEHCCCLNTIRNDLDKYLKSKKK